MSNRTDGATVLQALMRGLKVSPQYPKGRANRAIFCSRTLNLRSIQAIGGFGKFQSAWIKPLGIMQDCSQELRCAAIAFLLNQPDCTFAAIVVCTALHSP